MLPVDEKEPVEVSYNSALARLPKNQQQDPPIVPQPSPPVINNLPSPSTTAVWSFRGSVISAVALNAPEAGSYSSACLYRDSSVSPPARRPFHSPARWPFDRRCY